MQHGCKSSLFSLTASVVGSHDITLGTILYRCLNSMRQFILAFSSLRGHWQCVTSQTSCSHTGYLLCSWSSQLVASWILAFLRTMSKRRNTINSLAQHFSRIISSTSQHLGRRKHCTLCPSISSYLRSMVPLAVHARQSSEWPGSCPKRVSHSENNGGTGPNSLPSVCPDVPW